MRKSKQAAPPRYRETFTFLATIRSRGGAGRNISDLPEMPFCLWLGLWEVCTVPFGSGAALQCKQLTSSGWPLWTEQAASHEHAGAGGAQWFFSLTATGSAPEDCGPMAKQRTNLPTFERLWKILLCMNTSSVSISCKDPRLARCFTGFVGGILFSTCLHKRARHEAPFSLFLQRERASIKSPLHARAGLHAGPTPSGLHTCIVWLRQDNI